MMNRSATTRFAIIALLLCAVLVCLTIHSPHCDLCDGLSVAVASPHPLAGHPVPQPPDGCNGSCSCCVLQGILQTSPAPEPVQVVTASVWVEPPSPVLAPPAPIFRPPRTAVSI